MFYSKSDNENISNTKKFFINSTISNFLRWNKKFLVSTSIDENGEEFFKSMYSKLNGHQSPGYSTIINL